MSECPDENAWSALGEDLLGDAQREVLERHLDGCECCSRLVAELAWLVAADASGPAVRQPPERYRIVRQLGQGAMGVVWEAEDTQLGRRVALKWVRPEVSADAVGGAAARARLWREARALAQLRHPNVLAVHDVGEAGGEVFLALELVAGETARAWRMAAARTSEAILALWRDVAEGLGAVHRAGLVHRDIKPDNVLVAHDGRVLIGDFGLAKGGAGGDWDADLDAGVTATGQLVGTPGYMAPEQLRGEVASSKSDQFAWCLAVWEALTGARPFRGSSVAALAVAMTRAPRVPAGADRRVLRVLARGLDPDPARRWPDMRALVAALAPSSLQRRARIVIGASLGGLAAGGLAFALAAGSGGAPTLTTTEAVAPQDAPAEVRVAERATLAVALPTEAAPAPVPAPDTAEADATPDAAVVPGDARGDARPTATARGAAPIPVLPPLEVIPVTPAEWRARYDAATDRLGAGDGRGCLARLTGIPPVPPDFHVDIESLRARCMMAAGDCAGGRAELARVGDTHGWAADKIAREVDQSDTRWCPIDAPPEDHWPARALHGLRWAVATKRSCAPVLAAIARLPIAMPATPEYAGLRVTCAVSDGDCAGARARFVANLAAALPEGSPTRLKMEAIAQAQFAKVYPSCAER